MKLAAAEDALRKYCPSTLLQEYNGINDKQKETLLEALVATTRNHVMRLIQQDAMNPNQQVGHTRGNRRCPVYRILTENGGTEQGIMDEHLDIIRRQLATWGANIR